MKKTVLLLLILLIHTVSFAQKKVTALNQQWLQYYNTTKISKNWTIKVDGGYRWNTAFTKPSLYLGRLIAEYKLDPAHILIGAGIATFGTYNAAEKVARIEIRPNQDFTINDKYKKFKLQHRFRVEERFFKTISTGATSFNFRFRYRAFFTIPIVKLSKKNPESQLSLNVGDEIFINAGKSIVTNMFAQNRILIGPSVQLNKNWGLSLTYTYEYQSTAKPDSYNASDIFWFAIQHRLDFTGKKGSGKSGTKGNGNGSGTGGGKENGSGAGDGIGTGTPKE